MGSQWCFFPKEKHTQKGLLVVGCWWLFVVVVVVVLK